MDPGFCVRFRNLSLSVRDEKETTAENVNEERKAPTVNNFNTLHFSYKLSVQRRKKNVKISHEKGIFLIFA